MSIFLLLSEISLGFARPSAPCPINKPPLSWPCCSQYLPWVVPACRARGTKVASQEQQQCFIWQQQGQGPGV